ncbi:TPA: DUF6402 family protein, partial [Salmonella enterica subsp. diarizonae serovar 61:l,v:z35]
MCLYLIQILENGKKKHNTGGDYIVFSDVLWTPPLDKDRVI